MNAVEPTPVSLQPLSHMLREAREAPAMIARLMADGAADYLRFGATLREQDPTAVLTVARGSSDHAAHFMAYLIMARLGRLATSVGLDIVYWQQAVSNFGRPTQGSVLR